MNNCSYCGGALVHEAHRHVCSTCGKSFYDNPKAAVVIVLYTPDRQYIVLARRAHDPEKGKLDFVGGFLDRGENFEQAAYRELYEESGLKKEDITELVYFGSFYNGYLWEGIELPTTSACYMAEVKDIEILKPTDDVASFEHIHVNNLPLGKDGAWLNMDDILNLAVQRLAAM